MPIPIFPYGPYQITILRDGDGVNDPKYTAYVGTPEWQLCLTHGEGNTEDEALRDALDSLCQISKNINLTIGDLESMINRSEYATSREAAAE